MDLLPHIMANRERVAKTEARLDLVEMQIEQLTARPGTLKRLGFNVLSRDLLLAIGLVWAIIAGREDIAVKLILGQ